MKYDKNTVEYKEINWINKNKCEIRSVRPSVASAVSGLHHLAEHFSTSWTAFGLRVRPSSPRPFFRSRVRFLRVDSRRNLPEYYSRRISNDLFGESFSLRSSAARLASKLKCSFVSYRANLRKEGRFWSWLFRMVKCTGQSFCIGIIIEQGSRRHGSPQTFLQEKTKDKRI